MNRIRAKRERKRRRRARRIARWTLLRRFFDHPSVRMYRNQDSE